MREFKVGDKVLVEGEVLAAGVVDASVRIELGTFQSTHRLWFHVADVHPIPPAAASAPEPRVCAECKWCEIIWPETRNLGYINGIPTCVELGPVIYRCLSAQKPAPFIDIVTGGSIQTDCRTVRATDDLCGPSGKWWEPKGT